MCFLRRVLTCWVLTPPIDQGCLYLRSHDDLPPLIPQIFPTPFRAGHHGLQVALRSQDRQDPRSRTGPRRRPQAAIQRCRRHVWWYVFTSSYISHIISSHISLGQLLRSRRQTRLLSKRQKNASAPRRRSEATCCGTGY